MTQTQATDLLPTALQRFREETGLEAKLLEPPEPRALQGGKATDGRICIYHGQKATTFRVQELRLVTRALIHQARARLATDPEPGLLITPYLTPEMAGWCRTLGQPFLDGAGNAFLQDGDLFILVTGQKNNKQLFTPPKAQRAFDRTGLKVVFALLIEPSLLQATYRTLAQAAGVALGTVGWVMTELREQGYLVETKDGNRRWIDEGRVLQTWATNYPLRLRGQLHPRRYRGKEDDWWRKADPATVGGCWGGEVAALKLMNDLDPKTVTLYLPEDRHRFLAENRLRPNPAGPVEVLDLFWQQPEAPAWPAGMAPPLLVMADLQQVGDPRTLEQARMIHDRYLA